MKRTAGILIAFAGYSVLTFGWVMFRRFNITFVQWINPVDPYVWPGSGNVPKIPADHVFPTKAGGGTEPAGTPTAPKGTGTGTAEHACPPGYHYEPDIARCVPIK